MAVMENKKNKQTKMTTTTTTTKTHMINQTQQRKTLAYPYKKILKLYGKNRPHLEVKFVFTVRLHKYNFLKKEF